MKTAGELATKYLQWALEQKAKQDQQKDQPKTGDRP
jgi:hypothetical protein